MYVDIEWIMNLSFMREIYHKTANFFEFDSFIDETGCFWLWRRYSPDLQFTAMAVMSLFSAEK